MPLLAGTALLAGAVPTYAPAQQTPDPSLGAPLIALACAACHGQAGAGSGSVPGIAGYPRDQFIAQWAAFRSKKRPATIMDRIATGYTDAEVSELADYFSKLKK
jgi:sulfide dehydrogenase cytochrome subunit